MEDSEGFENIAVEGVFYPQIRFLNVEIWDFELKVFVFGICNCWEDTYELKVWYSLVQGENSFQL